MYKSAGPRDGFDSVYTTYLRRVIWIEIFGLSNHLFWIFLINLRFTIYTNALIERKGITIGIKANLTPETTHLNRLIIVINGFDFFICYIFYDRLRIERIHKRTN